MKNNDWTKLYSEPGPELFDKIAVAIRKEEQKYTFWRFVLSTSFSVLSFVAVFAVFSSFYSVASQNGLITFLSLLWTDSPVVFSNIGSYFMSLEESLPLWETILTLITGFVFISSLVYLKNNLVVWKQTRMKVV